MSVNKDKVIPKGYKQTDIGIIPEDWKIKPFNEISFMKGRIGWQGLKQTEFTMNIDEPFLITGMNFKDGEIRWDEVYHVAEERYKIAKEIQLKKDDVLMTKDGTIGKLLFITQLPYPGKATLNSHLLVFRPLYNSYYPKFLYYQLSSKYFKDFIEVNKSGTTFFGISQESVGNYNVFLPSIIEQKAIADAMTDIDSLIIGLEKFISKKKNIKQGTVQELLTGKKRLAGFTVEWTKEPLKNLCDYKNGKSFENKTTDNGNFNLVTLNSLDISGKLKKNHLKINFTDNSLCKDDLVIILSDVAHGNFLGLTDLIPENNKYVLNQRVGALKNIRNILPGLLSKYINFNQKYFKTSGKGSSQQNLGKDDILNFIIYYPKDSEEQTAIAKILSDMDAEIEALEHKRDKYIMLKQGMMEQLLTGKIRIV